MVRRAAGILCMAVAALAQLARAAEPALQQPVEPLRITTLGGSEITALSERGHILVINLWATWCVPCRQEMPALDVFAIKYGAHGVDVIAVSMDDRSDLAQVRQVMSAYSFPAALAADSDLRGLGRVRHIPATFVIDRNGLLARNGWQQPASIDLATLENMLRPLLGAAGEQR